MREKDDVYCRTLAVARLVDRTTLEARLATMILDEKLRVAMQGRIHADFKAASAPAPT